MAEKEHNPPRAVSNPNRKATLERLASPDQLDRLLVIIRPPAWVALLVLLGVVFAIFLWAIFGKLPITTGGIGIFFDPRSIELIQSEFEGVVEEVLVSLGDKMKKGDPLFKIRRVSGQEEEMITAPSDGRVLMVEVLRGETVSFGKNLAWFQREEARLENDLVYSFFSIEKGDQIKPGMRAQIMFDDVRSEIYGKMEGKVIEVPFFGASTKGAILQSIPSKELREYLTREPAPVVVMIQPIRNPSTPSGYQWTTQVGPPHPPPPGSVGQVSVFLEEKKPITYLIPLDEK